MCLTRSEREKIYIRSAACRPSVDHKILGGDSKASDHQLSVTIVPHSLQTSWNSQNNSAQNSSQAARLYSNNLSQAKLQRREARQAAGEVFQGRAYLALIRFLYSIPRLKATAPNCGWSNVSCQELCRGNQAGSNICTYKVTYFDLVSIEYATAQRTRHRPKWTRKFCATGNLKFDSKAFVVVWHAWSMQKVLGPHKLGIFLLDECL